MKKLFIKKNKGSGNENLADALGSEETFNSGPDETGGPVSDDTSDPGPGGSAGSKKVIMINKKKPWSFKKKLILSGVGVLIVAIITVVAVVGLPFLTANINSFTPIGSQFSPLPSTSDQGDDEVTPSPGVATPTPTVDPMILNSDMSIFDQTVNILLIGVDYAPERDSWDGKHTYHSDVMIVLSVNRKTNQVSLISLPRDTYAEIPGVSGIYKLNASLNCGGDPWPSPKACEKVCQAASWMLGGLPIQYYYAVDMTAVIGLVDAIGGVDYNMDIGFSLGEHTDNPRHYTPGMQHLSGQGVLDYLRVRHKGDIEGPNAGDEDTDLMRINRQKAMLKAILDKLNKSGLINNIPTLISTFDSNHLVTNVPLSFTYALATYSRGINTDDIKVYSMDGNYSYMIFNLNYVITNQSKRVQIIKEVFGFDITDKAQVAAVQAIYPGYQVPSYAKYDLSSAEKLWEKMQIQVTTRQAESVLNKVKGILDADKALPSEPTPPPPSSESPTTGSVSETVSTGGDTTVSAALLSFSSSEAYRKYLDGGKEWTLYNKCKSEYDQLEGWGNYSNYDGFKTLLDGSDGNSGFHGDIEALATMFNIKLRSGYWQVIYNPYYGKPNQSYVSNDIKVDPS